MNVGYLGRKPVTFGYEAATQMRGDSYVGFGTHGEIYESVREGIVDVGVLAVENQLAGEVDESLHAVVQPIVDEADRLEGTRTHVKIVQELTVPVRLFLMNQSGKEEDVELVMTHAVPMRQAKGALDRLRGERPIRLETCASTDAAAAVASQRSEVAAISSQLALDVYGLTSLGRVDDPVPGGQYHNVTRFWVIEKGDAAQWDEGTSLPGDEAVKVCLLFNLDRDQAGGLARSLRVFSEAEVNLAGIHSLPRRDRSWEYAFVVEFEVQRAAMGAVAGALKELRAVADYTLLGVYPKAASEAGA